LFISYLTFGAVAMTGDLNYQQQKGFYAVLAICTYWWSN